MVVPCFTKEELTINFFFFFLVSGPHVDFGNLAHLVARGDNF